MERPANRIAPALAAVVLAALFTAAGTFQPFRPEDRQADQVSSYWIVVVIFIVATALVYGVVLPRMRNVPRAALIFGILAVVTLPVFWLGLTPVMGVAALTLGWQAREASTGRGLGIAGLVLGAIGVLAGAVAAVAG